MGAHNLLILQGGGPTPVVNATLSSALSEAYARGKRKVFAARHAMEGLIGGHLVDLSDGLVSRETDAAGTPID